MVTRVYPASHPMTVGIGARATMRWKSWEKWIDRWTCGYQPLWLVAFSNGAMATVTDRHTFWPQCGFELRAFEVKNEVLFLTLIYLDEKYWKKIENPIHLLPFIQFGAVGEGCGSLSQVAWSKRQGIPRTDRQSVWANRERDNHSYVSFPLEKGQGPQSFRSDSK